MEERNKGTWNFFVCDWKDKISIYIDGETHLGGKLHEFGLVKFEYAE